MIDGKLGWFRANEESPWTADVGVMPAPEDLADNFAEISGKEAESLLMSARASRCPHAGARR